MKKHFYILILLSLTACSPNQVIHPEPPKPDNPINQKKPDCVGSDCAQKKEGTEADVNKLKKEEINSNSAADALKELKALEGSVYFDFDKDVVKPEYKKLVEDNASYLKRHPSAQVTLIGHTDKVGTKEYNLALGQRRSVAVKKLMNLLGIKDDQIDTISYGTEKPVCEENSEACNAKNRRAEINYGLDLN